MTFKDHFSDGSAAYARFRPNYPDALYAWLASEAPARERAWDCATGSGQAAVPLARHFREVVATDASERQIENAEAAAGVRYAVALAEDSTLPSGSVDVVTVAQALHWFDHERFYREVRRVCREGALIAAWTYTAARMEGPIGDVVRHYHTDVVGRWWPPERALVDAGYDAIPFPFARLDCPPMFVAMTVSQAGLLGYLGTWSATRRCRRDTGVDPLDAIAPLLASAWPAGEPTRTLRMPLTVLAGRV